MRPGHESPSSSCPSLFNPAHFNLLDHIEALHHLAEHAVAAVQPEIEGVAFGHAAVSHIRTNWDRHRHWLIREQDIKEQVTGEPSSRVTHQGVATVVMKNWEPLVLGPALA